MKEIVGDQHRRSQSQKIAIAVFDDFDGGKYSVDDPADCVAAIDFLFGIGADTHGDLAFDARVAEGRGGENVTGSMHILRQNASIGGALDPQICPHITCGRADLPACERTACPVTKITVKLSLGGIPV